VRHICEEGNRYEELSRWNVPEQIIEKRPQRTGQWLIRDQLSIPQIEPQYEIKRRRQKEHLRDLERYVWQDWRFVKVARQVRHMKPGGIRDKADPDLLQAKGWALGEYLYLLDEMDDEERTPQNSAPALVNLWRHWKHRSSAVLGMGGLAPQ
jgi:hypothetical protein